MKISKTTNWHNKCVAVVKDLQDLNFYNVEHAEIGSLIINHGLIEFTNGNNEVEEGIIAMEKALNLDKLFIQYNVAFQKLTGFVFDLKHIPLTNIREKAAKYYILSVLNDEGVIVAEILKQNEPFDSRGECMYQALARMLLHGVNSVTTTDSES